MTQEQERLVEDNIEFAEKIANYLSYAYSINNACLKEEVQSVALEQLCVAALHYKPEKGNFESFALVYIKWGCWKFIHREFTKGISRVSNKKKIEFDSSALDNIIKESDDILFIEEMTDLYEILTYEEEELLSLYLDGYSPKEIRTILGIAPTTQRNRTRGLKNKMKNVFGLETAANLSA